MSDRPTSIDTGKGMLARALRAVLATPQPDHEIDAVVVKLIQNPKKQTGRS